MKHPNIIKYDEAPETLTDHPFYGLQLDDDQIIFRDAIWNPDTIAILCNAKAGTGKTLISLGVANLLVQYGLYDGIVYIVSPTMEQKQGYLPGSQEDKTAPYRLPLLNAMLTLNINPQTSLLTDDNIQAVKNGTAYIEFIADTYLRGCNMERKVVIIDEAQNAYGDSLKKTLTRCHDNCKVIIIGHDKQCDIIKHPERSGFVRYLKAFEQIKNDKRVAICELTTNHRGWFSNFCDDVDIGY